jgi:hypothetical protein
MNIYLKSLFALTITSMMLIGCKADQIETSINSKDLRKAIAGNQVSVEFEAELSLMGDTKDAETKAQLKSIGKIIEKYLSIEEFDITKGDFGFKIKIEGELPLVYSSGSKELTSVKSPWVMKVSDNRDGGILSGFSHKLTFSTASQFDAFSGELQKINLMLSPDERQPMKFKLKTTGNDVLKIFTGGVEVGGEHLVLYEATVEKRVSLTMKGGVYDSAEQVVYLSLK